MPEKTWLQWLGFFIVAGVGLFADGSTDWKIKVVPMLGYAYFKDEQSTVPTSSSSVIKASFSIGMVIGQLLFGVFGDALGRKKVYGKELIMTIFGALLTIVMPPSLSHTGVVVWMIVFRIITGAGTRGDYPMTASLSAETSMNPKQRAVIVLTIFASIGLGGMASAVVYLILLACFKGAIIENLDHIQWVWRLLLGIGIIPCLATVYYRFIMKESKPYEEYVAHHGQSSDRDLAIQLRDFRQYFSNWRRAAVLFAASLSWFLFDIAFYGINLNQTIILSNIGLGGGGGKFDALWNAAIGNLIVYAAGYLPGNYAAIYLPNLIGRVNLQFWGSLIIAFLYAVWAGITGHTSTAGLIAIFTVSQFFLNLGPNATTFLIPVEVFPTRVRGTAHGICAASGKVGAIVTALAFETITERLGLRGVLALFAGVMALCAAVTPIIPETTGYTLDEIERDEHYSKSPLQALLAPHAKPVVTREEVLSGPPSVSSARKEATIAISPA